MSKDIKYRENHFLPAEISQESEPVPVDFWKVARSSAREAMWQRGESPAGKGELRMEAQLPGVNQVTLDMPLNLFYPQISSLPV